MTRMTWIVGAACAVTVLAAAPAHGTADYGGLFRRSTDAVGRGYRQNVFDRRHGQGR